MQIILVRHGRPDHSHAGWCTPREMKDWIARYNAAEVVVGEAPASLRRLVESADRAGVQLAVALRAVAGGAHR